MSQTYILNSKKIDYLSLQIKLLFITKLVKVKLYQEKWKKKKK